MVHTLSTVTRRLAAKLLASSAARPCLGVEALERRDNPNGTISGFAFQDFNANGTRDLTQPIANDGTGTVSGAIDRGIAGVVVTAFDAAGAARGTTVTDPAGAYTLNAAGTGPYRVEFTALPQGSSAGPQGTDSKTTVQFVPDGVSMNVSVGLTRPGDYAQLNPLVATSRYVFGDQINGTFKAQPTVIKFPYSSGGTTGNYTSNAPVTLATAAQVGTTLGLSANPVNGDLFASAYFKRHAGYGPGGSGAIYRIANANSATPGVPAVYADLNALFGANTAGANRHDVADYDRDNGNAGWAAVGTTGLGGSDISDDGRYLYVMNLADRQLYRVPTFTTPTAANVTRVAVPLGNPDATVVTTGFNSNDVRPFAVQYYRGKVYVGVTYTAQTYAATPGVTEAQARAQLLAAVYEFDPVTQAFAPTPVFTARLNYARNQSAIGFTDAGTNISPWRPWSATYFSTANSNNANSTNGVAPQAMLSDISFDAAGNMNLGLRDRGADQIGYYALSDPARDGLAGRPAARIEGFTTGDILRAFANTAGNLAGGWTLENNARGPAGQGAGPQNNSAGPGGGEFFYQENFGTSHGETSMDSLLQLPGRPDVTTLQMDPSNQARAGGLGWMNNATGAKAKSYQIYLNGNTNNANSEATFSKANGLGGLTALVDRAPIEVGNRVWADADGNGRQDPNELGIANVTVQLLDALGNVISVATTDAAGEYYFTSAPGAAGAATDPRRFGVPFARDTQYTIRIPNVSGANKQAALGALAPTVAGAAGTTALNDSNGVVTTPGFADASFRTGEFGQNDHTLDFGFRTPGTSVSGFVYIDANNNGVREAGETDITQSVTLRLTGTDSLGNAVLREVTTTTGAYTFADVPSSDAAGYTITQVNQPTGLLDGIDTPGTPFGGSGGAGATDAITGVVVNATTAPVAGGVNYNFGEIRPAVLGDFVWLDANGDGRFEAGESPVSGILVTLTGTTDRGALTPRTANTNAAGNYLFDDLRPGTYVVTFGNTAGGVTYTRTFKKVGANTAIDSDADRATGASDPVVLPVGGSNLTIDAGLYLPVSLGDTVWVDTNRDGVRQAGEPGIVGATVTVVAFGPDDIEGTADDATTVVTTGADGFYTVGDLPPGRFRVRVDETTGTVNGVPARGLAPTYDLDSGTTGPDRTTIVPLILAGGRNPDADFGFTNFAGALGDRVWLDRNGDGVQQPGEPGIAGVPVTAVFFGADGQPGGGDDVTFTATTGADGIYNFVNLPLGRYRVTIDAAGTNLVATGDLDSPAGTGDNTALADLTAAVPGRTDVDFGLRGTAAIGDTVYYDIDGNGVQGPFEPGIAGVPVTLTSAGRDGVFGNGDDLTFTATTSGSGTYLFTDLPVFGTGTPYRVTVTPAAQYPTQTVDADGLGTPNQSTLTLAPTETNLAQDFGYRGPLTQGIGDFVWVDADANGRFDAGELGLNGVTVELLDAAGNVVNSVLTADNPATGAAGFYEFRNLAVGTYRVRFGDSAGGTTYLRTAQNSPVAGVTDDSDASATTGETADIAVPAGTFNPTIDAGLFLTASLGDTVFRDDDGNQLQNGGEPGIAGVRLTLDYAGLDGVFGTADDQPGLLGATTGADGKYLFTALRPGTYRVTVDATTLPAGLAQTVDLDGLATPNVAVAAVASAQTRLDADFGYRGVNALGDLVWYDLNKNGVQDNAEPGIAGVAIDLVEAGADGVFFTADDQNFGTRTTDAAGKYLFTDLPAGSYRAVVRQSTLPAGLVATFDLDSGLVAPDSVAVAALGGAAGAQRLDVDFGYAGTGSIGDRVWFDANGNGTQDPGEPGIPGITVSVLWAGPDGQFDTGDEVTLTRTTGTDGLYLFTDLPAGPYVLTVTPTPGLEQTGDPDAVRDNSSAVTLTPGQTDLNQDFGYRGLSNLGGTVYVDVNKNGRRDAGEPRIPGVVVTLTGTDTAGNPVTRTATTAADGTYLFTNLAPGTYGVVETQPPQFADGEETLGTVGGTPAGSVGADRFDRVVLTAGSSGVNYDFGEVGGTVSGRVFLDRDRDGLPGAGEPPIPSVLVVIRDSGGTVVGTATTGPDGTYRFDGLPGGDYTVTETQPGGYGDTPTGPFAPNTRPVTLPPGVAVVEQNFGETLGTVSGVVYADVNRDGVQNPSEPGIAGVVLTLVDAAGNPVATATTDAAGNYAFTDLPGGNYSIVETQPSGYADGATAAGPAGGTAASGTLISALPLAPGGAAPRNLFGEVGTGSVTGVVFLDGNRDGVQNPGEAGIPRVSVGLLDRDGTVVAAATTDADGRYTFTGVAPGDYTVVEVQPADLGSTANSGGNTRAVSVVNGQVVPVPSFPDTLGTIAGTVYVDADLSATRGAGEAGLAGVTLQLLDAAGTVVASTTTDAAGNYRFTGLPAGSYTVVESQPAAPTSLTSGYYDGADNPGSLGGTSPAKNRITVGLPAGGAGANYDFGEFLPVSPFGFVYVDANRDGLFTPGETPIAGVAVTVSGTAFAGTPFARPLTAADVPGGLTALTDANGRWAFPLLPPGVYSFSEAQPAGFLDGQEQDADPAGPPATVGNDLFSNVRLTTPQQRGPFNFGESVPTAVPPTVPPTVPTAVPPTVPPTALPPAGPLTPINFFPATPPAPVDPTKRQFLGSTRVTGAGLPAAPALPTAPNFATRTGAVTFVAVAEDIGGGMVRVFDYQSGVERFRFAPFPGFAGGVHAATGDVTGDGVPDIITTPGVGGGPIVRVFDGVTGQVVREVMAFEESFRGGLQLAVGDFTGDGVADVVVAPDAGGGPIVRAFDGRTFAQVANFFALDENFRGGLRLGAGDLNADGRADLVVTAGLGGGPRVAGYDGATLAAGNPGKLFGDFFAFAPELRSGFYAAVGDVDGDGFGDIVLGAGPGGGPRAATYSGRALTQQNTPAVLGDVFAGDPADRGGVRVMAVDLDGDGRAELVSGSGTGSRPTVRVTDPRTGAVKDEFYAFPADFLGGVTVG